MKLRLDFFLISLSISIATACTSTTAREYSDAELSATARTRSTATVEDVALALELADLGPLAVPVPSAPAELRPDMDEFWHAAAYAWNPELRAMRRRVRAAQAELDSAGKPQPIQGQAMALDLSDPAAELEFQAMVDLLGLLGVGPADAAKKLASATARAELAALEARVWSLRFDVDRARVELAAAKSLETALAALYGECSEVLPRIEILAQRGWIGRGMTEGALSALHMLEHHQSIARLEVIRARSDLAALCGLDSAHPAFDEAQSGVIDRFRPEDVELTDPSDAELLARLPELRSAKLELAVAEAELVRMARERWPMIGIGPRTMLRPDEQLLGGMIGLSVPFPGALEGAIAAQRERRDASYEALESALVAVRTELDRTARTFAESVQLAEEHAPLTDMSMARMLAASQAEFLADPERLERWSFAVGERLDSLMALVRARAELVRAWLDCEEARGPRTEVAP